MMPGEYPLHWVETRLRDIVNKLVDGSHNPPPKQAAGLPMLSAVNITNNTIDFTGDYRLIDEAAFAEEDRRTSIVPGDVLLTIVGAIGRAAVVPTVSPKFTLQRSVAVFGPTVVDPKFLMYQFEAPRFAKYLKDNSRGTAQKGVYLRTLGEAPILLPPRNEQRRIVAKIEELLSELDQGVGSLNAAHEQLKAYRQAVLKDAFEGRKAGSSPAWRPTRLGDEIQFLTSGSRGWADYYASAGDTFIRAQNLKNDRLDLTDIAFVKLPPGKTEGVRTRVKVGDVLITITGANVTKTGIVSSDLGAAYVSQHVALCRPSTSIAPAFLYWYLLSEVHGRRQLNKAAYGAGKPGLNLDNIRDVRLSLPSPEEQVRIVERVETALAAETRLLATIEGELQRTEALRQSILTHAFSGRLVAQDPKDEAASSLLGHMRSERKDEGALKKMRKVKNGRKQAA